MLTGVFRASYTYVFQPQVPKDGGEPKYSVTMLIPKSDVATYQAVQAEINQALQAGVQKAFNGQMPSKPMLPIHDGDGTRKDGDPFGEECRGCWVLKASSKTRPAVVDINIQPIIDPNAFYSGCYARASINFFAYNVNGNKGIGCGLNNIQKIADGEPLSGRPTAEDDFGGSNAWNGPATYGTQFRASLAAPSGSQGGYSQGIPPQAPPVPQAGYVQGVSFQSPPAPQGGYGQGLPTQGPPVPQTGYAQTPAYGSTPPAYTAPYPAPGANGAAPPASPSGYPPAGTVNPVTGLPAAGGVMGI